MGLPQAQSWRQLGSAGHSPVTHGGVLLGPVPSSWELGEPRPPLSCWREHDQVWKVPAAWGKGGTGQALFSVTGASTLGSLAGNGRGPDPQN